MSKKTIILFVLLSLRAFSNEPFSSQILGSDKVSICSIRVPYKLKINKGLLIQVFWTVYCDDEIYTDYTSQFNNISLNTPTNNCSITIECEFVYYISNDDFYYGYDTKTVQIKTPTFTCNRSPGIDGVHHSLDYRSPIHFNIDDDDNTGENNPIDLGWDYLQDLMQQIDNDLNHVTLISTESDLNIAHCVLTFTTTPVLKAWRSPIKGCENGVLNFLVVGGDENIAHIYIEGVELGKGEVSIIFNNNIIQTLKYEAFAVVFGRQPKSTEHRPGYRTLVGCEWSIIDYNTSFQGQFNSLAYAVDPTQNEAYGCPFLVEMTSPLCQDVYTLVSVDGLNKTSVDTFGNRNGGFSFSDVDAFFEYQPIWPDSFLRTDFPIADCDVIFYFAFFASKAATAPMKVGKYNNWILFHSKYNQAEIVLHRSSQINMGSIERGYIFCPSLYPNLD